MEVLGESVRTFRVWPNDVDVRKITNDRFIALMDLGRMDIAFRVGLFRTMLRRHWAPLVTFAKAPVLIAGATATVDTTSATADLMQAIVLTVVVPTVTGGASRDAGACGAARA